MPKKKLALVCCVHHKPWLIMSTIITALVQDFKDFDIFFLHQKGDGNNFTSNRYKEYFDEYRTLANKFYINRQLDAYDPRTQQVCNISPKNIQQIFFENDHALDSGAWYKFIRTSLWKRYDYVFFAGEGVIFTGESVFSDTLTFAENNHIHFITGSQEKRRIPKRRLLEGFASEEDKSEMAYFHDKMIRETFAIFCRDKSFKEKLDLMAPDFPVEQQHHVPDIWGRNGYWMNLVNKFYLTRFHNLLSLWLKLQSRIGFLQQSLGARFVERKQKREDEYVYVNEMRQRLKDVVDYIRVGNLRFHRSNELEWFGATCNHFMSRQFLEKFAQKLEEYKIYDCIELPFAATALEIIWGLIPPWLGFDKWFFDGIHRVRKNFVTYRREDDPEGMARYINRYYQGKFYVEAKGDYIKIKKYRKNFQDLRHCLNELYF